MIKLVEHKSSSYGPRTFHNAKSAQLTAAIAINFNTAGEKLTHKAAGECYITLPFLDPCLDNARRLYVACKRFRVETLNIAGNGIATFADANVWRETVHQYVFNILRQVHAHYPIQKIVSGGQTGVDIAGAMAACKLGIDAEITFPLGFRQRDENRVDHYYSEEEIMKQIVEGASKLC